MSLRVAVVGGGPAGLMAAISAAGRGHQVRLYEKNSALGKKLLITGGGRCNLTTAVSQDIFLERLIGQARFLRPSLSALSQNELRQFFESRGVPLKAEGDKIYPKSDKAQDILECLMSEMKRLGVDVRLNTPVTGIVPEEDGIIVQADRLEQFDRVIIATGGVSYSVTGSDGKLLETLKQVGRIPWRAGLISLYTKNDFRVLMGISLSDASLHYKRKEVRGELLFTHYGLSGPAALGISSYLSGETFPLDLAIDFLPDMTPEALADKLFGSKKQLSQRLNSLLPKRLLAYLLDSFRDKDPGNMTRGEREIFLQHFKAHPVVVNHLGDIEQATISLGGVDLKELRPKTLEHRTIPGLYFAGECLDLSGPTGGYNLQIAFSTGYLAGRVE